MKILLLFCRFVVGFILLSMAYYEFRDWLSRQKDFLSAMAKIIVCILCFCSLVLFIAGGFITACIENSKGMYDTNFNAIGLLPIAASIMFLLLSFFLTGVFETHMTILMIEKSEK